MEQGAGWGDNKKLRLTLREASNAVFRIQTFENFVMLGNRQLCEDWLDDAEREASDALQPSAPVYCGGGNHPAEENSNCQTFLKKDCPRISFWSWHAIDSTLHCKTIGLNRAMVITWVLTFASKYTSYLQN